MTSRRTPFDVLREAGAVRRVTRSQLLELTIRLEDRALADPPQVSAICIQDMRFASPRALRVWSSLAAAGTDVTVYGRDVTAYLGAGVAGVAIDDADPLVDVWSFLVVWPDGRAAGFAGTDLGDDFDVAESEQPGLVLRCLGELGPSEPTEASP